MARKHEFKTKQEAIEVTISWERCEALGITDALEPELQLSVTAALENRVEDVSVGFSSWDGVDLWDSDGEKIEPPESVVKAVNDAIANAARRLTE